MLAASAGDKLLERTRERYLKESKDPFLNSVFRHIILKDFNQLTNDIPLSQWKEALAYSLSFAEDTGKEQALTLGQALLKENDMNSALLCFIMAMEFEMVFKLWLKKLKEELKQSGNSMLYHRLFEKIIILKTVCKSYDTSPLFDQFIL